jgi:hypothetical protein
MTEQRFWAKVEKTDGCWLWTAAKDRLGYGYFKWDGKQGKAYRYSWTLHNGPIPTGMCVLHRCDTPSCVNPAHLFLGTQADNVRDMDAKGRRGTVEGMTRDPAQFQRGEQHWTKRAPDRVRRGEAVAHAKLTWAEVAEIRAAVARGDVQRHVAARYSVSPMIVSRIVRQQIWKAA